MRDDVVAALVAELPIAISLLIFCALFFWIAKHQITLAKAKLKLSLFEKRHYVFMATWTYLSDLAYKTPVTTTDIFNFSTNTANAKFLFGDEIVSFLEEAKSKGIELGTAEHTLSWPSSEEAKLGASAERHKLVNWVQNELKNVKDRFKPYLDVSHW